MFISNISLKFFLLSTLLILPISGLAHSNITGLRAITLESVLAQAEHFRTHRDHSEQYQKALTLYELAADSGSAVAQYWLGVMHFEGKGTESNQNKAVFWLELSAEQGHPPAEKLLSGLAQIEDYGSYENESGC